MLTLCLLLFPSRWEGLGGGFKLWIQIDKATVTDWMPFLPSKKPSTQIPEAFNQHEAAEKTKNYLGIDALTHPIV